MRIRRMKTTDDKRKGMYEKFRVERVDGRDHFDKKHYGCFYFVLDTNHDPFAIPALRAYAEACKEDYPLLAADIITLLAEKISPQE